MNAQSNFVPLSNSPNSWRTLVSGARRTYQARDQDSPFFVPRILDLLGDFVEGHRECWIWLSQIESNLLRPGLEGVALTMPIYVCGLARSGSTLMHEILASHSGTASQRVKDYPMLFTPHWWRRATTGLGGSAQERPHRDKVMITAESPDALEEMLWMAFFRHCHDPSVSNLLSGKDQHPRFEAFYRDHLRKLLLAERATRYVAKANYHVARLGYLSRLFPDVRFIIPVREPVAHIASLFRQHQRFSAGQRSHPRALHYMQRSGHFEFD